MLEERVEVEVVVEAVVPAVAAVVVEVREVVDKAVGAGWDERRGSERSMTVVVAIVT